jgi:hypothetical protein
VCGVHWSILLLTRADKQNPKKERNVVSGDEREVMITTQKNIGSALQLDKSEFHDLTRNAKSHL